MTTPVCAMEQLETRRLLTPQISLTPAGVLTIEGTDKDDSVNVRRGESGGVAVRIANAETQLAKSFPFTEVNSILFYGGAGDDTFRNETDVPVEAHGEAGNDILYGGSNNDLLFGDLGDDILLGCGGDDILYGSEGHDVLKGHNGNDQLYGGAGNDFLVGGAHDDELYGNEDYDILHGGSGNDRLNGGAGDDQLFGEAGIDALVDSIGNDINSPGPQTEPAEGDVGANNFSDESFSSEYRIVNVKEFGAVGDGVTDDTAAVQAAIDAAEGGELYLSPGTYRISEALLVPSNTVISGAGSRSVLEFTWRDESEGRDFYIGNRNRANEAEGDVNIQLRDFAIKGGDNGDPYGPAAHDITHGIFFRKVMNVKVIRVEISNTSGFAICNVGVINGTFTGNDIHDVGRDGITSFPLVDESNPNFVPYPLDNLLVAHNKFENVGDDAIAVHAGTEHAINNTLAPSNIFISNNSIVGRSKHHELSQGRGIALTGVRNATVDSNFISQTVTSGIIIQSWWNNSFDPERAEEAIRCSDILVTNNILMEAGAADGLNLRKNALHIEGADRLKVANNLIRKAAGRGISVGDATLIELIGNEVYNSQGNAGIVLVGGDNYDVVHAIISDNIIEHWNENKMLLYNVVNARTFNGASDPYIKQLKLRGSGGVTNAGGDGYGSTLHPSTDTHSSGGGYLPDGFGL